MFFSLDKKNKTASEIAANAFSCQDVRLKNPLM